MPHSKLTSKGQITIPGVIRKKLNLKTGDRVDFMIKDGEVTLVPVSKEVKEVFGILSRNDREAVSIEQMNESVKRRIRKNNI